jgi:hypothetical protein
MSAAVVVELTLEEATAILEQALAKQGASMSAYDASMQLKALAGVIEAVRAMQELGYRIVRPLRVAGEAR